jgi:CRISPR system Cascade subunit CasB
MSRLFEPGSPLGDALFRWWKALDDNRGDRAELRRCEDLLQVMQTIGFQRIRSQLVDMGLKPEDSERDRLAAVIGLTAHVTSTADPALHMALPHLAEAFSEGDKPAVSPLRFRQLLDARTDDELFTRLRRVLPLVKARVSLFDLANSVFYWGDSVRKRWVYDYRWPAKEPA